MPLVEWMIGYDDYRLNPDNDIHRNIAWISYIDHKYKRYLFEKQRWNRFPMRYTSQLIIDLFIPKEIRGYISNARYPGSIWMI